MAGKPVAPRRGRTAGVARRLVTAAGKCALGLLVAGLTGWASLAIYFSNLPWKSFRMFLAAAFAVATLAAFLFFPRRARTLAMFVAAFALVAAGWWTIPPSNSRDWQAGMALLPHADITADTVMIRNIRNFSYRTEADFDAHYYDKTFDLRRLDSVDLIAVYWMGDAIAHIIISFGFGETDYIAFSIEARREKGEEYSSLKGFFKQYEIYYVAGDERDLVRLRTEYRHPPEDVYLFRTRATRQEARRLFLDYAAMINRLEQQPEFYNSLLDNCTVDVVRHIRATGGTVGYNWQVLLSGYAPRYAYGLGLLDARMSFDELRKRSYINPRARAIGGDPEFSRRIRQSLPRPPLREEKTLGLSSGPLKED